MIYYHAIPQRIVTSRFLTGRTTTLDLPDHPMMHPSSGLGDSVLTGHQLRWLLQWMGNLGGDGQLEVLLMVKMPRRQWCTQGPLFNRFLRRINNIAPDGVRVL